jgi:Peptidase family M28
MSDQFHHSGRPQPRIDRPAGDNRRVAKDPRIESIHELCEFEGRLTGTDAERRAANHLAARLRALGRRADVDPTYVHPQAPLVWAAHAALALAGSLVAVAEPAVGFALVLLAATSLYLDLNARLYLLRLLFFRRASQNVVSPGPNPDAPARLLLVAHYDAGRAGTIFKPGNVDRLQRLSRYLPIPHTRLLFWSAASLLPLLGARMAGADSALVAALQLVPTLLLLVALFLLVDVQLSGVVPGANDNASGVAVALSLAGRLRSDDPRNLDVWIVLTGGAEAGMEGMRAFLRGRKELDRTSTYVLAIDAVGAGDVRWVESEGLTVSFEMDRRLLELCAATAEADREGADAHRAAPLRHGFATDALAARVGGWRAAAITCLEPGAIRPANHHTPADVPEAIDAAALDRAEGFARDLIRALDRDVERAAARPERELAGATA